MATVPVIYNAEGSLWIPNNIFSLYWQKCKDAGLQPFQIKQSSDRTNPHLVAVVRELDYRHKRKGLDLRVIDIPAEYAECYTVDESSGAEQIICDPTQLVAHKLQEIDLNDLTDRECREKLEELIKLIPTNDSSDEPDISD